MNPELISVLFSRAVSWIALRPRNSYKCLSSSLHHAASFSLCKSAESIDGSLFVLRKVRLALKLNLDNTDADNIFTVLEQAWNLSLKTSIPLSWKPAFSRADAALLLELKVEGDAPVSRETEFL